MTLEEIILKLVGPIEPIGDSRVDEERLQPIKDHLTQREEVGIAIEVVLCFTMMELAVSALWT